MKRALRTKRPLNSDIEMLSDSDDNLQDIQEVIGDSDDEVSQVEAEQGEVAHGEVGQGAVGQGMIYPIFIIQ